jgi:hypothetical protein
MSKHANDLNLALQLVLLLSHLVMLALVVYQQTEVTSLFFGYH